jgi:hypothetical protein
MREPYRLFRMDRTDTLLPLLRDLSRLSQARNVAGRDHGWNSKEFDDACEAMRWRLYNEQETIIEALRELKDATEPEASA